VNTESTCSNIKQQHRQAWCIQ